MALTRHSKGVINKVYTPPLLLTHHASYDSMGYGSHIPNRPLDYRGAYQSSGFEGETHRSGYSHPEQLE